MTILLDGTLADPIIVQIGYTADAAGLLCEVVEIPIVADGSGTPSTVDDANLLTLSGVAQSSNFQINYGGVDAGGVTFESSNEAVAMVTGLGYVAYVSAGPVSIAVVAPRVRKRYDLVTGSSVGDYTVFDSLVAGSLGRHIIDAVDAAIAGKVFAVGGPRFTTLDPAGGNVVVNANCVLNGFTGVDAEAIWSTGVPNFKYGGSLIAADIVMTTAHGMFGVGDVLKFVKVDGSSQDREIISRKSDLSGVLSDTAIYRLASPVSGIAPMALLSAQQVFDYLPSALVGYPGYAIPAFHGDQSKHAHILSFTLIYDSVHAVWEWVLAWAGSAIGPAQRQLYFTDGPFSGDSGHRLAVPVNGALVLVGIYSGCYLPGQDLTQLNAGIASLGSIYSASLVNLAGFNFYG